MPTLAIWASLLKHKVGIIGTFALFLLNIPAVQYIDSAAYEIGYFEYKAINEGLGLALFAIFFFPVARLMLRDQVEQGLPRFAIWIAVELLVSIAIFITIYAIIIIGYIVWPELAAVFPSQWQEFLLEVLIAPLLLGVFVWQVAMVLGRRTPSLRQAHGFVWEKRRTIVLVYLAVSVSDLVVSWAITQALAGAYPMAVIVAFSARYAIYTWLLSLLVVAVYLDLARRARSIEDVFA